METNNQIQIQLDNNILRGTYSNYLTIQHTPEEFVLDFMSVFGDKGTLNSRVVVSPGHLKRMIDALSTNFKRYETSFGREIIPAAEPPKPIIGFHNEGSLK